MKPIKLLLSLCAMLVVTVGAWGQSAVFTAPTPAPSSACGGSKATGITANLTLTTCTAAQVRLDVISTVNGVVASSATIAAVSGSVAFPDVTYPTMTPKKRV